jgi:V/A-type H+-transporting ATPase subunit C
VGTRAFALRGTLLDPGSVQKLSEATTLEELVNRLRGTPYGDTLAGLTPPYSARKLELSFRERLVEVHHSIMATAGKFSILELYYLRHIAWDLKIALKSRALGRSYEETAAYVDMKAEALAGRRDLIVKVLSAKDATEAVSMLSGTEFYEDAVKSLSAFSSKGDVRFFDIYIDHAVLTLIAKEYATNYKVYSSPRATDVAGVGDMVSLDIDGYNALSVLRSKLWGLPEQEVKELIITPTYRIPVATLMRMVGSESASEAAKLLESAYPLSAQAATGDEQLIDAVEESFTKAMKNTASKAFVWQGLSPGTALALVKLLEFEVSNLAAIAIGVEAHIDPKNILSRLRL